MTLATVAGPSWSSLPLPPFPVRRFSVAEYHRLRATGILGEEDPVELLEGWIVPKLPRSPEHDVSIELIAEALRGVLPSGWRLRVQSAITTTDSEPEPDVAVVKGAIRSTASRHPAPAELGMLVEVADSSVSIDRNDKGRLFAQANIPIYWLVNLPDACVEVYSDPSGQDSSAKYQKRQDYRPGQRVPVILEGQVIGEVSVSDLLP